MSSTGRTRNYLLQDELTGARALDLADRLAALPFDDMDTLVLSLAGVGAVDASGVAILVRLYSRLVRSGKRLVLRDIPEGVEKVLRRVGLGSVFLAVGSKPATGLMDVRPVTATKLAPVPPPQPQKQATPPADNYDPSLDDLVSSLSHMEPTRAIHLLRTVVERLGLSAEGVGLTPSGSLAAVAALPSPAPPTAASAMSARPPSGQFPRTPSGAALPVSHAAATMPSAADLYQPQSGVLRKRGARASHQAISASSVGLRWGPDPARTGPKVQPGSRTEQLGWAWWDFLFATQNLPLPAGFPHGQGLPQDLRALLLDYLEGDDEPSGPPRDR